MNKKPGIFKRIGRFFDKFIITPVTRVVMKISRQFGGSSKSLETFLSRSNTLLFVSLFLAILLFIWFDQKRMIFTDTSAEVLKDRSVEAVYNEEAYVVEGLPEKVDITLMGSRSDLFIAKQSSKSKVTVDLTGLKAGTHKVNIEYTQPMDSINYSVNPSVATVNIYPKVSESKTLTTDLMNQDSLDSKLVIDNVKPEVDRVVIKGTDDQNAVNSLTKVASVKALVDVEGLNSQDAGTVTLKDVPLKAYDKNGKILDVEIVPSKIKVSLDLSSPNKEVPIKVIPKGTITFGKAISNISMSESKVTVYGKQSVLDNLQYVPVEVDVDGLKNDREYKLELTKPSGIKSMSLNNVTVGLTLGPSTDKDINDVNIDVRNLNDKYSVQGLSENDIKVTVNVKGVDSVLKQLTSDDITAYINLKNYKPGEYEVPVKVEGTDSRVQYLSKTKKVKIKIVEK
jgi:YbbR domain-containing protein